MFVEDNANLFTLFTLVRHVQNAPRNREIMDDIHAYK